MQHNCSYLYILCICFRFAFAHIQTTSVVSLKGMGEHISVVLKLVTFVYSQSTLKINFLMNVCLLVLV